VSILPLTITHCNGAVPSKRTCARVRDLTNKRNNPRRHSSSERRLDFRASHLKSNSARQKCHAAVHALFRIESLVMARIQDQRCLSNIRCVGQSAADAINVSSSC
jgi:hypothetical protein